MEKEYCIYKHTNKINGKVYIGKTCQPIEKRFGHNGIGYKGCSYFYAAIQKYGWDNFDHEIIEENIPKSLINEKEKEYIKKYDSTNRDKGYNIRKGGDGFDSDASKSLWEKEEYKEKIIKKNIENWNNDEYKSKMKQKMKEAWKDSEKRKRRSNAAKERWSNIDFYNKTMESVRKACNKKVICVETNQIFDSVKEAFETIGYNAKNASQVIKTGRLCGGYHWKYYDDVFVNA